MAAKQEQDEPDIRIRIGFFRHHKTERLRRAHGWDGVVCLQVLWCWARTNRHKGGLSGMTDEDIEIAAGWTGSPVGAFAAALAEIGWLDGEAGDRRLHNWKEHQAYAFNADKRKAIAKMGATARHAKGYDASKQRAGSKQPASNQPAEPLPPASTIPSPSPAPALSSRSREADAPVAPTAPVAPPVRKSAIVAPLMTFPPPRAMP